MTNIKTQKELQKYFVSYGKALTLKKLGFDDPCLGFYNSPTRFEFYESYDSVRYRYNIGVKAPLIEQAKDWIEEWNTHPQ